MRNALNQSVALTEARAIRRKHRLDPRIGESLSQGSNNQASSLRQTQEVGEKAERWCSQKGYQPEQRLEQ